jgi:hypothetical protein
MLRWWDGEAWSETEFKLRAGVVPPRVRRDLLLGPFGRRGSIVNIVFCAGLVVLFVVFALTVHPLAWGGVAIGVVLLIVFIAVAILVRRVGVADHGQELVRRLERRHTPEDT